MYYAVHKGLRLGHARLLEQLGATDWRTDHETREALSALRSFLALAHCHLHSEETRIHPVLDAAETGAARVADEGHDDHETAFAELQDLARAVEDSSGADRDRAGHRLYMRYALFAAADLEHMAEEETILLGALHRLFGDDRLREIEGGLVAAIAPSDLTRFMALIAGALSVPDLAAMLAGMRDGMPPEAFAAIMRDAVEPSLPAVRLARLAEAMTLRAA